MAQLGITNRANFNRTIRKHEAFREAMADCGATEVASTGSRYNDAFSITFSPDPDATYFRVI
ncbi:hypothetical protein [Roseobacter ponti]|nr:hypothetical protein [Roseobacter ponti]